MNHDAVYALLVEANPVPDSRTITPVLERLHPAPTGSETMQLTETRPNDMEAARPPKPHRWMMAAAATLIAVAAAAVIMFARDDPEPPEPATQLTTVPTTVAATAPAVEPGVSEALAAARDWQDALLRGDVDAVVAATSSRGDPQADRHLAEMWAVMATFDPAATLGDCSARDAVAWIEVRCDLAINDPVWIELGVDELVVPMRVDDDLTVRWMEFEGADVGEANRAYADYLRAHRPTEYEAVCSPAAYEVGTIVSDKGLALTGACAELWMPLADDIAQWIRDGRPNPDA